MDDIVANREAIRFFEDDGKRYCIYVTAGGGIACERLDEGAHDWEHMPLRDATELELSEVLKLRYNTEDEEIARAIAAHEK